MTLELARTVGRLFHALRPHSSIGQPRFSGSAAQGARRVQLGVDDRRLTGHVDPALVRRMEPNTPRAMRTNRRTIPNGLRGALLLALLVVVQVPTPARAASAVDIQVRSLLAGRYEPGGWAALEVTLVNDGTPTDGWLISDTDAGSVRRFVEMPAGSRKVVTLYVQPGGFQRQVEVRYEEPNGIVRAAADVRIFEHLVDQLAIVGDGTGILRAQLAAGLFVEAPEPVSLGTADLPDRPEALSGLATIVWAADSATLGDAQRRAVERWVADGGRLIVVAGADWQSRTASFLDLLPVQGLAAADGVSQAALAGWAGSDEPPTAEATVTTGTLHTEAQALVSAEDGTPLLSMRPVGAGRVILIGSDLATDAYRDWDGSGAFWSRMLPTGALFEAAFGGGLPDREQRSGAMQGALNTLPSLDVPPAELLLAVIVGYILLIGPVSYLVLRRLDRRELAWVTAPVLVLLFTACSYGIGVSLKGSQVIVNQLAVVRSSTAGTAATVETYAGVFSPTRATFDMLVEADALFGQLRSTTGREQLVPGTPSTATAEQGDPARLGQLVVPAGGYEYLRADAVIEHQPMLQVTWSYEEGRIAGTVTNIGDVALEDVAYVSVRDGEMIGTLEPGESGEFELEDGPNQSSASDQIYGFDAFDAADDDRRRIVARRGVIDALVGYSGWVPSGSELGGATGGRGPFVVGWHAGDGPMPILLEDVEAQRYAQIAEVVSIQPELGQGEIIIGPAQMGVSVTTDGDATVSGPGTASIIEGTATWSLSLPLTASDMTVTGVDIVFGPDAASAIQDPGAFANWWPAGYLVELRDPTTGEWNPLGDLGEQHQYTIEDPASAVSTTGRIELRVRVDGTLDANFGQPSVFASAQVTGVLDR